MPKAQKETIIRKGTQKNNVPVKDKRYRINELRDTYIYCCIGVENSDLARK